MDALESGGLSAERVAMVKLIIENAGFSTEIAGGGACVAMLSLLGASAPHVGDFALDGPDLTSVETELAVVKDADKLDAIGAVGIARTFTFGGARGRPLYDPDMPLMTSVVELSGEAYARQVNPPLTRSLPW